MSCFPLERKHKDSKAFAENAYVNVSKKVAPRVLHKVLHDMRNPSAFAPFYIGARVSLPHWAKELLRHLSGGGDVTVASSVVTPRGGLRVGDRVLCSRPAGLVTCLLFAEVRGGASTFWAIVGSHGQGVDHRSWSLTRSQPKVVDLRSVLAPVAWCEIGGRIVV